MNNKGSGMPTISIKRDNSKAQISGYLLNNKNQLPDEIVLGWQNFEQTEELLNNQIQVDLKRIDSTVAKKKDTDFLSLVMLTAVLFITSAFIARLVKPKMLNLDQCLENLEQYQLTNNQKRWSF